MLKKYLDRLEQIDYLIRNKATGSPKQMAAKLGLSIRMWHFLREELVTELNFPIAYCPMQRSYYYTYSGKFEVGFKPLTVERKEGIKGGMASFVLPNATFSVFGYI